MPTLSTILVAQVLQSVLHITYAYLSTFFFLVKNNLDTESDLPFNLRLLAFILC